MQRYRYIDFKGDATNLIKTKIFRLVTSNDIIVNNQEQKDTSHRFLMLINKANSSIITISQTINEVVKLSQYPIDILNIRKGIPRLSNEELKQYSGIILHNTVAYDSADLRLIFRTLLKDFEGIRVLIKQDEHYLTDEIVEFVRECGIDLVLSIWKDEIARQIYDPENTGTPHIMSFLTGYVPDYYKALNYENSGRSIDIGYRGSIQPLIFGQLCYEKRMIGEDFINYTRNKNLVYDISSRREDRIYGKDWLDFLGNCKGVLGVESGSSIVDRNGMVRKNYDRYLKKHPAASDEDVLAFLKQYEGDLTYYAISPRHFEAAACRSLQVMYEGEFQGIFKPHLHYVPLKRDFSNIEEVVEVLLDDRRRKEITDRAFEEIILDERYSFKYFVERFDRELEKLLR